jgi:hypothetical protein
MDMGHVRSFYAIGIAGRVLPPFFCFKVLRVLVLERCVLPVGSFFFGHLGKLVQLRYLALRGIPVTELPTDIGHDLKFLQTLDIQRTRIKELPPSVGELTKLVCLCVSERITMISRIGKLTSLEELQLYHVEKTPDFCTDLGKLKQLRVLFIKFNKIDESMYNALVKSVGNLRKIQTINFISPLDKPFYADDGWEDLSPPLELRLLSLRGVFLPIRPSWVDSSCVPHLSTLWLFVKVLKAEDLQILGRLPSLRNLLLISDDNVVYTVGSHEFLMLRYLITTTEIVCGEGALLMLEELNCHASAGKDVGLIGNMPLLKTITYQLDCVGLSREEVETAEAQLSQAAETHTNRPFFQIGRRGFLDEVCICNLRLVYVHPSLKRVNSIYTYLLSNSTLP